MGGDVHHLYAYPISINAANDTELLTQSIRVSLNLAHLRWQFSARFSVVSPG
jgi:hypothetical protein